MTLYFKQFFNTANIKQALITWCFSFLIAVCVLLCVLIIAKLTFSYQASIIGVEDVAISSSISTLFLSNIIILAFLSVLGYCGLIVAKENNQVIKFIFSVIILAIFAKQVGGILINAESLTTLYNMPIGTLLLTTLPHSLIELSAIYLPIAFMLKTRNNVFIKKERVKQFIIVFFIGAFMLLGAACIEHYVWPVIINNYAEAHLFG